MSILPVIKCYPIIEHVLRNLMHLMDCTRRDMREKLYWTWQLTIVREYWQAHKESVSVLKGGTLLRGISKQIEAYRGTFGLANTARESSQLKGAWGESGNHNAKVCIRHMRWRILDNVPRRTSIIFDTVSSTRCYHNIRKLWRFRPSYNQWTKLSLLLKHDGCVCTYIT